MQNFKNNMPTAKYSGRKLKNDVILIISLIIFIFMLALCLYLFSDEAKTVTVTIDGKHYGTYSMNENATIDIKSGANEENINRLVILDGEAYVSFANCPDGICSSHRPISRTGESIICLPNKVVITTKSTDESIVPDIIT